LKPISERVCREVDNNSGWIISPRKEKIYFVNEHQNAGQYYTKFDDHDLLSGIFFLKTSSRSFY
jgi:hypothetical protein